MDPVPAPNEDENGPAGPYWPRRDSNPHGGCPPQDFKSRASTDSATRPGDKPRAGHCVVLPRLPTLQPIVAGFDGDARGPRPSPRSRPLGKLIVARWIGAEGRGVPVPCLKHNGAPEFARLSIYASFPAFTVLIQMRWSLPNHSATKGTYVRPSPKRFVGSGCGGLGIVRWSVRLVGTG